MLARGELGLAEIDAVADRLAAFHRHAARTPPNHRYGSVSAVRVQMQTVLDSFERETRTLVPVPLPAWCESEGKRSRPFAPVATRHLAPSAYSAHSIDHNYNVLLTLTRQVLEAGYPALVDATFLKHEHPSRFAALGNMLSIPVIVLDFHARTCRLWERVRTRALEQPTASDAGPVVLVKQLANEEPLTSEEMADTVYLDTEVPLDAFAHIEYWEALRRRLEQHAAALPEALHA